MPIYSMLSGVDVKIICFAFERQQHIKKMAYSLMNEDYREFIVTEGEYILWELEKRKLTESEVIAHAWMATSLKNTSLIFDFQKDNQLTIRTFFENKEIAGVWQLDKGILTVRFLYHLQAHVIHIIANNNRHIHSALQIVDNNCLELLKVAPLHDAKEGQALLDE